MKGICAALIILLLAGVVHAAPAVTGVSGTVAKGQTITISGTSFGANGPAVRLFDSFEKGTLNSAISLTANSADIGNWSSHGDNHARSTYSNEYGLGSSRSMRTDWSQGTGWVSAGPKLNFPGVNEGEGFFLSWWQYLPTNRVIPGDSPGNEGANWKIFWVWDDSQPFYNSSDFFSVFLAAFDSIALTDDSSVNDPTKWTGDWYETIFNKGIWTRFSVYLRSSHSNSGIGWQQEINANGQKVAINASGVKTTSTGHKWSTLTLPGYGREDNNAVAYLDDVYVATGNGARARIEIGESATYANCRKPIILPTTAWSNTQATAVLHSTGQFVADDQVYLFVVDADGGVSPGYGPLTIGSGGGDPDPDTTNPNVSITTPAQTITGSTLTVIGTASDNDAVSSCRWQRGSVPTISTGSACTGTTSFSCVTSGHEVGTNTVHVACFDPSDNRGSDSVVITRAAADTTPPSVTITTAPHTVSGTTTTIAGNATDNVGVTTCRWRRNTVPTSATNGTACTGTNPFSCSVTGLQTGTNTMHVACFDSANNRGSDSVVVTRSSTPVDTTPPVLSGGQPSGILPAGTTSTTVSLTTDEDATCRWMSTSGTVYANMTNTFTATGAQAHSMTAGGLSDGQTYHRYVRCSDISGNANTSDYHISWSVASLPAVDTISIGTMPLPYVSD